MRSGNYILFLSVLLLAASCANMSQLGGGPKDETPPRLLSSNPENNSLNFSGDRISFVFDEYLQLKNAEQKLLVSPPMTEAPEITAKNRELTVKFKSQPEPNTTYTLNFADGVADLTEGNPVTNFMFTFSTGSTSDSLQIAGRVINAFTLEPEKNVSVFLYRDKGDSLPYISVPYYVTKADNSGNFRFFNIRKDKYSIVAVNDKNNNYKFDPPEEAIAFMTSEVFPFAEIITDTSVSDTLPAKLITVFGPDSLELFSFRDEIPRQKVKKSNRNSALKAEILFSHESVVSPKVKCIGGSDWISQFSFKNDSLVLWAPDTVSFLAADTLMFDVEYGYDSLGTVIMKNEKVKISPFKPGRQQGEGRAVAKQSMRFSSPSSKLHPNSHPYFEATSPVKNYDPELFSLSVMKADSQFIPVKASLEKDSLDPRKINILAVLEPGLRYKVTVKKDFIIPVQSSASDSASWEFTVNPAEMYGTLKISISSSPSHSYYILTDEKGNQKASWANDTVKVFSYLLPGKYRLMLYIDENSNKHWDPGRYLAGKQPEKVLRYDREINVRANWDLDVLWDMKEKKNGKPD